MFIAVRPNLNSRLNLLDILDQQIKIIQAGKDARSNIE